MRIKEEKMKKSESWTVATHVENKWSRMPTFDRLFTCFVLLSTYFMYSSTTVHSVNSPMTKTNYLSMYDGFMDDFLFFEFLASSSDEGNTSYRLTSGCMYSWSRRQKGIRCTRILNVPTVHVCRIPYSQYSLMLSAGEAWQPRRPSALSAFRSCDRRDRIFVYRWWIDGILKMQRCAFIINPKKKEWQLLF